MKDKLDQKNSLLSEKEIEFLELNENSKHILNNIQLEIDQIPIKEARAQKNINKVVPSSRKAAVCISHL